MATASLVVAGCLGLSVAAAADLYWNGVGSSGSAGGGSGTWNATATNWETAASGGTPSAWTAGDNGFFGGAAGTVDLQSALTAGTLTGTTSGYTLTSTNGSGLSVAAIDISALGANGQLNVDVKLTGTGTLSLAGAGDTTSTGGGNPNLGIRLTNAANDFVGDVTLTNRLVSYTSDAVFGAAANAIVMAGGGLLDNNVSVNLARDIDVQSGGGIIRLWNASTPTWSGAVTGSGPVSRTDMGTLTLSGDLSGYSGTYTQAGAAAIATVITGGGTVGGNWTATNGSITFNSASAQSLAGATGGSIVKSGAGVLTLTGGTIAGNFTVNAGGGVVIDGAGTQTLSGLMSGVGSLTKTGSGTLTQTARNTISGPVTVSAGTLQVNDGRSMSGAMTVSSGATLTIQNNGNGGFYQPASLDVTAATVNSVAGSGSSGYHGIYTDVLNVGAGTSTISVPLFMNKTGDAPGDRTLVATVAAGGSATISSAIANHPDRGGGALTKAGAGTLTLSGGNVFTGELTINAGTLNAGGTVNSSTPTATALGNMTTVGRSVTVRSGATLSFISSDTVGQFNYASPVMLIADGGTITRVAGANTFNAIGSVTLRNGGRLTTTNGNASTVGSFAINGSVIVDGSSGSFIDTLAGQTSNSYINLGTNASSSTTFDVAATGDATADLTVSAVLGDRVLGGAAGLVKVGAGTMRMTASNAYSGGTTVRAGTLVGNNNNAFGTTGTITLNDVSTGASNASLLIDASGGTVTVGRPITVANQGSGVATIGASANAGGNFATFSGAIALDRSATLVGPGAGDRTEFTGGIGGAGGVTVSTSGGTRIIFRNAANSYAGQTTITGGSVLQLSDGTATSNSFLSDVADVAVDGTLNLAKGNSAETVGGLLGSGTVANLVGGVTSTLVVGGGDRSGTFSGSLANPSGTLTLTKTGAGTQVLSAASSYTGGTTINGGTLVAGHASALGTSGAITINSGGTFGVADGITFTRPLTINAGGKVRTGDNSTVALPSVAALAAWESQSNVGDQTLAEILDASGSSVPTALSSAWTANPGGYFSDVLTLEGTGAGNTYVLSMEYSGVFGDLNIWYRQNVSDPFAPLGTSFQGSVPWSGSFATVGQYGVDTTTGTVWVVTDHNSQFVVVPEPGSVGLVAVGLAVGGLVIARRRGHRLG